MQAKDVAKTTAREWAGMNAEQKQNWETTAASLREQYHKDVASWESQYGKRPKLNRTTKAEMEKKDAKKDAKKAAKAAGKLRSRPLNAYNFFFKEQFPLIRAELSATSPTTDVTKAIAQRWRVVTEADRQKYVDMAKAPE